MTSYSLEFPADFASYEWEIDAKGYFTEARLKYEGKQYRLSFYDPVRLMQDIEAEIERDKIYFEPNLVIVHSVTRPEMERAAQWLVQSGQIANCATE